MEERRNFRESISEAQDKPNDFLPKERAQYVRDMITLVENSLRDGKSKDEIKQLMPTFVESYSNLFDTLTNPGGYDKNNLKTMLAMLDRMASNDLSQHQASVIVGKKLAEKYIKPDELPQGPSS